MTFSTVGAQAAAPSHTAGQAKSAGLTSAAEQQDRFMTLLVAQMRNQDPLNPMDNAQMTTQIAQINTVAGIERLNATTRDMAEGLGAMLELQAILLTRQAAPTPAAPQTPSTPSSTESTT